MAVCELHFVDKCPLPSCRQKVAAPKEDYGLAKVQAEATAAAERATADPVHVPNWSPSTSLAPEITDPTAKNVLQLAGEYARAQDEVATMRGVIKNLRSHLAESEKQLKGAEALAAEKNRALQKALTPGYIDLEKFIPDEEGPAITESKTTG